MAYYENLMIYKSSFDLCIYFEKIVKKFDKYHKYTIGAELKNISRKITLQVIKANLSLNKQEELKELILLIEELKLTTRICQEVKGFPNRNSYNYVTKLINSLSNQSEDWLSLHTRKSENKQNIAPEL